MAFLIDDIFLSPFKGVKWLADMVKDVAERAEEKDESKLQGELLEAQMLFEADEINEEEYQKREDEIMVELNKLMEERKKGGGKKIDSRKKIIV